MGTRRIMVSVPRGAARFALDLPALRENVLTGLIEIVPERDEKRKLTGKPVRMRHMIGETPEVLTLLDEDYAKLPRDVLVVIDLDRPDSPRAPEPVDLEEFLGADADGVVDLRHFACGARGCTDCGDTGSVHEGAPYYFYESAPARPGDVAHHVCGDCRGLVVACVTCGGTGRLDVAAPAIPATHRAYALRVHRVERREGKLLLTGRAEVGNGTKLVHERPVSPIALHLHASTFKAEEGTCQYCGTPPEEEEHHQACPREEERQATLAATREGEAVQQAEEEIEEAMRQAEDEG